MDFSQIFQAFLALLFVLGLLFVTLWLIKYCQHKGIVCQLGNKLKSKNKIKIIEHHRIDVKNSLLLIQDNTSEYLLLIGANNNLLLNQHTKIDESISK